MVVNGNEQRVYGTLVSGLNCKINLHRFALVYGSGYEDPDVATTVYYGDTTYDPTASIIVSFDACGYLYTGYITILFIKKGAVLPFAAIEVRLCKTRTDRIVIETYGNIGAPDDISLWFNSARDVTTPIWNKLNLANESSTMPYATESYKYRTKSNETTVEITDCCSRCSNTCKCLTCALSSRIFALYSNTGLPLSPPPTTPFDPRLSDFLFGLQYHPRFGWKNDGMDESYVYGKGDYFGVQDYQRQQIYIDIKYDCDELTIKTGDAFGSGAGSREYYVYAFFLKEDGNYQIIGYGRDPSLYPIPNQTFTFAYEWLYRCASISLDYTGCQSFIINYPFPTSPNASFWSYELPNMTATFEASFSVSPSTKCFADADDYNNFTWNLTNASYPTIVLTGKNPNPYNFIDYIPTFEMSIDVQPSFASITVPFNNTLKTGDIYTVHTPKYVSKTVPNCINIVCGSTSHIAWYTTNCGPGYVVNDNLLCFAVGGWTDNMNGIVSFLISTYKNTNAIHITSFGKDFWIQPGFLQLTGGEYGGAIFNVEYTTYTYNPDGSIASYQIHKEIASLWHLGGFGGCIMELIDTSMTTSLGYILYPGNSVGCIKRDTDDAGNPGDYILTTTLDQYDYYPYNYYHVEYNLFGGQRTHTATGKEVVFPSISTDMVFDSNRFAVNSDDAQKIYFYDTLLTKYLPAYAPVGMTALSVIGDANLYTPNMSSIAVIDGIPYTTCRVGHYLARGSGFSRYDVVPGITLSYGAGSILKCTLDDGNTYMVIVSNSADAQYLPTLDIIPMSMIT